MRAYRLSENASNDPSEGRQSAPLIAIGLSGTPSTPRAGSDGTLTRGYRRWRSQSSLRSGKVARLVKEIHLRMPAFMPIIYLGSSPMLKRTECHQWVDFGSWNDHFDCRGRAFGLIPVGTFNHGMAYPLNAKLIRRSIGGHTKTTMFKSHKPSRHRTKRRFLDNLHGEDCGKASMGEQPSALKCRIPLHTADSCAKVRTSLKGSAAGAKQNHN